MKYHLIFIAFFLSITVSNAQIETDTVHLPANIFKFSPISLLDFNTPSIQFSYEKQLKNNAAIQMELGYITNPYRFLQKQQGYRARIELRRYDYWHTKSTKKGYIGAMIMVKQSFKDELSFFSRYDGLYLEKIAYQEIASGIAAYFTMGKQYLFKYNTSLEIGFAAGVRYVNLERQFDNLPSDAVLITRNLFDAEPGAYIFPSVFPVLKLGYYFP